MKPKFETYTGWNRQSVYIPIRDNTKLAVDIYRPMINDLVEENSLPVIWAHNRYRRAYYQEGKLRTLLDEFSCIQSII